MKLKKGQVLYIDNQKYTVNNMIEFKEDSWIWQEYEIVSEHHIHKWLSMEEDENKKIEYYLYEKYNRAINTEELEFEVDHKKYELYEKGIATVKDYFGNADVDKYETCNYYDYISEDKKTIISVEKWEGETEKSIGFYLENERIKITEELEKSSPKMSFMGGGKTNRKGNLFSVILVLIVVPVSLLFIAIISDSDKPIMKYLEQEGTKYNYITSVTNNTNRKKAKVYESSFSNIDLTVKDIIDGVPEGITKTIDSEPNTEQDGIGLQTDNEYAYIYEEEGKVYIQVSSKEYMKNSGSMYHSRHHRYYYHSYTSTRNSDIYSSYAYSARQNSINSRKSTGGGTSSGK